MNRTGRLWSPGPQRPLLEQRSTHVWLVGIDQIASDPAGFLPAEEIDQAAAARSQSYRRQFYAGRIVLRSLLSSYLNQPPDSVPIEIADHGRPRLRHPHPSGIDFNLSHSERWILAAFSRGANIGVDVELESRSFDWARLGRAVFSDDERILIDELDDAGKERAGLRCWVRKEAYTKARTPGFAYGFANLSVSLHPEEEGNALLADGRDPSAAAAWWIRDLPSIPDAFASIAGDGDRTRIDCWQLSDAMLNRISESR